MSSVLITANWSTYTYAIVTNQTLEASLGYFMNPLVSVLLGTVFLKEKLNKAQMLAIVFACAGVMWVTFKQGEFPALGALRWRSVLDFTVWYARWPPWAVLKV